MSPAKTSEKNDAVIEQAKQWFKLKIIATHIQRTKSLGSPSKFKINPFTAPYLSAFLKGEVTAKGIAASLVYARALGTSISGSFGTNLQSFISDVLVNAYGSTDEGIDIKFEDSTDGRTKYAQLKLGPNNINKDDVDTINNHFKKIRNRARTNNLQINVNDLVVCVMYGDEKELSAHYKKLRDEYNYPVYVGKAFWYRMTGDENFYEKLVKALAETLAEVNSSELLESVISKLAKTEKIKALAQLANN
jgi:hypothetical protein